MANKISFWESFTHPQFMGLDADGEPKYRDGRIYYCERCRYRSIIKHRFCPNCGSDMIGGKADAETLGKC